jgi:hypothetical protein
MHKENRIVVALYPKLNPLPPTLGAAKAALHLDQQAARSV